MTYYRFRVSSRNDEFAIAFENKKIVEPTKQMIYKKLKEDYGIKRVYTRKSSIVCTQDQTYKSKLS